ncbi:MAG: phenylalanine--tRNA ligase subunit beta [Flavobacteriales bacterium]|nr:phenylalanine--tRNA ligase subunit beta [Flavobacteriales bacterium]MDG1781237.1 phenylalanine--tRNA ligase subunit beta [Flavobacteriales bacterium]MDG2245396.1 phenylalanine--tRNA ligase subunit beta [Flavobacteriales bacterium]
MKISYNWLRELYSAIPEPEKTSEALTNTGLEVEGLDAFVSIEGALNGLVVGEVLEKWKHPGADRLNITKVDVGQEEPLQIVCGAPNVDAGQKVIVATVGAKLYPNEGEPFVIKKGKIRGEASMGMICAEDEIGLGKGHDGIMVLKPEASTGMPAGEYFEIYTDHSIEIGLTPNRTDAMSHYGVARDLRAAVRNAPELQDITSGEVQLPSVDGFAARSNSMKIDVQVDNNEACQRYAGVCIKNVTVGPSPEWLQNKLKVIGLSPINNIVDITNFVLHEVGQPLHAFDADKIAGNKVVVRLANQGEKFTTLDDTERELNEKDLMICDENEGMCIAGVFGGAKSGITEGSTNVFLESAVFDTVFVRKTARRHQLNTDASYRFERGVDPELTIYALKRAALLMEEIAGGEIASDISDYYPTAFEQQEIEMHWSRLTRLIGKELPQQVVKDILSDLDFEIANETAEFLALKAPLYRRDVTREADVAEEILRIYGYNNIEMPERLTSTLSYLRKPDAEGMNQNIADLLVARGYLEFMNNSLTKLSYSELIDLPELSASTAVRMKNPLSSDLAQMRQTLLYQGLETISRNINFKQSDIRSFEFGRTYHENEGAVKETPYLTLWVTGKALPESWKNDNTISAFADLKGGVSAVFDRLGLANACKEEGVSHPFYSDAIAWKKGEKEMARMGVVAPSLLKKFDIKQAVYYAEIDWNAVVKAASKISVSYKELAKYPAVRRDLSLLVSESTTFKSIQELAHGTERKLLKEVGLFDVYEGKNLAAGTKSYAVSFILQDENATLTDKKIDKSMQRIQAALTNELGAQLR